MRKETAHSMFSTSPGRGRLKNEAGRTEKLRFFFFELPMKKKQTKTKTKTENGKRGKYKPKEWR